MSRFRTSICFLLALSLLLPSVAAAAGSVSSNGEAPVARALDEFNYGLAVTWDQEDPAFRAELERKLVGDLLRLEDRGISKAAILGAVAKELANGRNHSEVTRLLAALREQNVPPETVSALLLDYAKKNGAEGTAFRGLPRIGRRTVATLAAVVVVGVVAYLLITRQIAKEKQNIEDKAAAIEAEFRAEIDAEAARIEAEYRAKIDQESEETKAQYQAQIDREIARIKEEYRQQIEREVAKAKEELRAELELEIRAELERLVRQCGVACLPR